MAEHNLTFRIGSTFSGEGFKKAQQAVASVNGEIKRGTGAMNGMSRIFGELDMSASKTLLAVGGLAQAVASFNVVAIALQVGQKLVLETVDKYFEQMKSKADRALESANALKASMEAAFSATLSKQIGDFSATFGGIVKQFDETTRAANAMTAAINGLASANAKGGIASLQIEKINALLEAYSDEERALIEQTYNLKIATQQAADVEYENTQKINAAHQAVVDSNERINAIENQLAATQEERARLEDVAFTAKMSNDEHYLKIQEQVDKLKADETKLLEQRIAEEKNGQLLAVKEQTVRQEAANAQAAATLQVKQAELAGKKLEEAEKKSAEEFDAFLRAQVKKLEDATDHSADSLEEYAQALDEQTELEKKAKTAASDLAAAQREYAGALKAYNSHINQNLFNETGRLGDAANAKARQDAAAAVAVEQGLADGTIRNSWQQHQAEMAAARAQRDYESSPEAAQIKRDAQRYDRLKEKNEKTLSPADKKFLEDEEKRRNARDAERNKLNEAQRKKEEAEKADEQAKKDIAAIRKKLEQLGLK